MVLSPVAVGGEQVDTGLVVFFAAPNSFTGEDCAELQVHGSPAVVRRILRGLAERPGIRLAEAGEFTRRAFHNGRMDLTAIEGLGDLLQAETEDQRRQALRRLEGGLSRRVDGWRERLLDIRAEVEAVIDFSDEGDVGGELAPEVTTDIAELASEIGAVASQQASGRIVREGFRVGLAGAPNAGKSSLLNALTQSDVAIVTAEAGTTRDVREVALDLGGSLVILVDMAGLRETDSLAEAEGVSRARAALGAVDLVLWLVAPDVQDVALPRVTAPVWRVGSKSDLGTVGDCDLVVSATTGDGLAVLLDRLRVAVQNASGTGEPVLVSHERDVAALKIAQELVVGAVAESELELVAERLRGATTALERLLGRVDSEMVLDRLFAGFCIGK